jgi:hypothetical protein
MSWKQKKQKAAQKAKTKTFRLFLLFRYFRLFRVLSSASDTANHGLTDLCAGQLRRRAAPHSDLPVTGAADIRKQLCPIRRFGEVRAKSGYLSTGEIHLDCGLIDSFERQFISRNIRDAISETIDVNYAPLNPIADNLRLRDLQLEIIMYIVTESVG